MHLSTFLLADHAESVNGKLYVTGGAWNRLSSSSFPVLHPHMTVAAVIHVPWDATNEKHALQLELVDADGRAQLPQPIQGEFEAGRPPGLRTGDEQLIVFAFHFNGLTFETEGVYEFALFVDGAEVGRLSFRIDRTEVPTTAS